MSVPTVVIRVSPRISAPSSAELCFTPATELKRLINNREVSPVEITEAVLRYSGLVTNQPAIEPRSTWLSVSPSIFSGLGFFSTCGGTIEPVFQ